MSSLESVRAVLTDYLDETSPTGAEMGNLIQLLVRKDFLQRVYDTFFDLISDPTQSPDNIKNIVNTFTSELNGFSTNYSIQTLVAFACFEGLARRRPTSLNGPWESLVWVIVNFSSFSSSFLGNEITKFKKPKIETLMFIIEFCTPELCPNPCLRLELLRLIRTFSYSNNFEICQSLRDKVINTLLELCDNYTSLAIYQVPNVSPIDLQHIFTDNVINMYDIMKNYDLKLKQSEIIVAVLKLTKNFALLEKDKQKNLNIQRIANGIGYDGIEKQLSACLYFFGLLSSATEDDGLQNACLMNLVEAVGNDSILQNYVIDTLDTVIKVSLSFPNNTTFLDLVSNVKDAVFHRFFKSNVKKLPQFRHLQEMYGGFTPADEYRLRRFQKNTVTMDQLHDSDNDSECYSFSESYIEHYEDSEDNDMETDSAVVGPW